MHQFKHYLVIFACNIFLVMPVAATVGYPAQPLTAQGDVKRIVLNGFCDDVRSCKVPGRFNPVRGLLFLIFLFKKWS